MFRFLNLKALFCARIMPSHFHTSEPMLAITPALFLLIGPISPMKHVLIALALALGTMSCSKKEAVPPAVAPLTANSNTGSYKLDGRLVTCTAKAIVNNPSSGTVEYLYIVLTTTPQPATGAESLSLSYSKPRGQANSAYSSENPILFRNQQQPVMYMRLTTGVATNNAGGFSGEFTASISPSNSTLKITEGMFTDVRP